MGQQCKVTRQQQRLLEVLASWDQPRHSRFDEDLISQVDDVKLTVILWQ